MQILEAKLMLYERKNESYSSWQTDIEREEGRKKISSDLKKADKRLTWTIKAMLDGIL